MQVSSSNVAVSGGLSLARKATGRRCLAGL